MRALKHLIANRERSYQGGLHLELPARGIDGELALAEQRSRTRGVVSDQLRVLRPVDLYGDSRTFCVILHLQRSETASWPR